VAAAATEEDSTVISAAFGSVQGSQGASPSQGLVSDDKQSGREDLFTGMQNEEGGQNGGPGSVSEVELEPVPEHVVGAKRVDDFRIVESRSVDVGDTSSALVEAPTGVEGGPDPFLDLMIAPEPNTQEAAKAHGPAAAASSNSMADLFDALADTAGSASLAGGQQAQDSTILTPAGEAAASTAGAADFAPAFPAPPTSPPQPTVQSPGGKPEPLSCPAALGASWEEEVEKESV
jgi:hypothetical protein